MNEFMSGLRTNLSATIATSYLCKQCCQTIQAILCFYARYPQVVSLIIKCLIIYWENVYMKSRQVHIIISS